MVLRGLISAVKRNMREELIYQGRYDSLRVPETPFKIYDRQALEEKYGKDWGAKIVSQGDDPMWVVNIPREFYDFEDFGNRTWDNYDLLLPGYGEVLSGARREWEYHKMIRKMERDGVMKENYRLLLTLAREGKLKPSAGAGIGVERVVSWIAGAKHIGETQMFPRIPGLVNEL